MCWAVVILIATAYIGSLEWDTEAARRDGVFFVAEQLDAEPASNRAARLDALRPNFSRDMALIDRAEVERRVGRSVEPGERLFYQPRLSQEWHFVVFGDGAQALAAGPVNPAVPVGVVPVGMILALIGLPGVALWLTYRMEREMGAVEHAAQRLAEGELSARVDDAARPSNELADSFNAMAERIERLVRSRDELVQAVSHELGSPLSRLRFHLELLEQQGPGGGESRTSAMARELDALEELVSELLTYVQSDESRLDVQRFDPRQTLENLAELASLDAPDEREVAVELELAEGVEIVADRRLFQRAIENLLRNAVRYADERIRLELVALGTGARVSIHDDGPGIPEGLRDRVLKPFARLESDRGRRTGGVGLGLAIVSRIVSRHEGTLAIDSSTLGGASVATTWPQPTSTTEG